MPTTSTSKIGVATGHEDEPTAWRDRLRAAGDTNDEYLVARLRQNWAGRKIGSEAADWLKDSRRTW